ncbi:Rrf2 family transcriptional regulator [Oscillibacter sp.]|uniref:RrF2 family transcriptional regulator n=1 Tax=Oscillibacter sp. TaxID=1945593 RepID=UPI002171AFD5|nr:Rrf2 family transcriptional regulator [Oscillibacter sp.]MCI9647999.1 Rrf2 family transcriptional regulator [Oscillibacter sp.]
MLVTREMDYAMRVVRALDSLDGLATAAGVAELEQMPQAVTLKILKRLTTAGIVESRRGPAGGYRLRRSPEALTLYDLFRVFGREPLLNRCQAADYRCENYPDGDCGTCRELCRIQEILDAELRRTPLSRLFGK